MTPVCFFCNSFLSEIDYFSSGRMYECENCMLSENSFILGYRQLIKNKQILYDIITINNFKLTRCYENNISILQRKDIDVSTYKYPNYYTNRSDYVDVYQFNYIINLDDNDPGLILKKIDTYIDKEYV